MLNERQTAQGILVTGASGFLAGELIPRLLKHYPESTIYLLLRAENAQQLAERRQSILQRFEIEAASERIVALAGDIEQEDLGLGGEYDGLAGLVTEIYHSAASTNFLQSLEAARKINFQGSENVLNFARRAQMKGNFKRLHHVSTAYISGNRLGLIKEEELDCGQGFFNTYEQSKYESELSLKRASREMPITIYRPSIIVGDSQTGRSAHFYVIYEPMKWVYNGTLTFLPCRPDLKLDVVPVDYVCEAMLAIGRQPNSVGQTYHLTSGQDRSIDMTELVEICLREFNQHNAQIGKPPVAMPEIITPDKIAQMEGEMKKSSEAFFQRAWQQMSRHMPYVVSEKIFDDSNTRAALAGSDISCPSFGNYLPVAVRYALKKEFRNS